MHSLAKGIINDEEKYEKFIESLHYFISEVNKLAESSQVVQLDEKKKLDAVDIDLLTNSSIDLGFQ